MQTEILSGEVGIARAVELLRTGEIVALPTETVYGLAADALNAEAVAKIFSAKSRPHFDPLIVHLPDLNWLEQLAHVPTNNKHLFERLIAAFWPGPLTFILGKTELVPPLVTAGLETVALRQSAHPLFQEVIRRLGKPLAAPSANRFGRISPTNAAAVRAELEIPAVLDGGAATVGIESTVVELDGKEIRILRPGPISPEMLAEFGNVTLSAATAKIVSPGQLESHYAPKTKLIVVSDISLFAFPGGKKIGVLCFGRSAFPNGRTLSLRRNLDEAAANLFKMMRELDEEKLDLIVAELVPEIGIGIAINDRLRRAAAGR